MKNIKKYFGEKIAIEYASNWGFGPLAYIAKSYFEELGFNVVNFHLNVSKILDSRILFLIKRPLKKIINFFYPNYKIIEPFAQIENSELPSISEYILWRIQALLWSFKYYFLTVLRIKSIFEAKIDNILVGDAVVATSVRISSKYPSKLRFENDLFNSLIKSYLNYKYGQFLVNKKKINTLIPSHNVYDHNIRHRAILKNGGKYLYLGKFPFSVLVDSKTFSAYHPSILPIDQFDDISPEEQKLTKEYLDQRISPKNPNVLSYMQVNPYSMEGFTNLSNDLNYNQKEEQVNIINVCIFLHSFADALFVFGHDSFNDIWEWINFTIDELLDLNKVQPLNILIKPHPNIFNYKNFKSNVVKKDYFTYQKLEDKYKYISNINFIDSSTSNLNLIKLNNFIGITHHGNIAPELAYLNKPVIASLHGPWKNCNDFLITWKNKKEYSKIIKALESYVSFQPCISSLLKFTSYYYRQSFSIKPTTHYEYNKELFYIAFEKYPSSDSEIHENSSKVLEILKNDEIKYEQAKNYLEELITVSLDYYKETRVNK